MQNTVSQNGHLKKRSIAERGGTHLEPWHYGGHETGETVPCCASVRTWVQILSTHVTPATGGWRQENLGGSQNGKLQVCLFQPPRYWDPKCSHQTKPTVVRLSDAPQALLFEHLVVRRLGDTVLNWGLVSHILIYVPCTLSASCLSSRWGIQRPALVPAVMLSLLIGIPSLLEL